MAMGVLVQGQVRDRPWGQTLGALGLRNLTGQLTLHAEGKAYAVAFAEGTVIGAWSPNASDSAPRVALTNHLLSSSQVAPISRRIAALPDRDEVDIVAEIARLTPEQIETLRTKLVAQRAARTFAVEDGEFVVEDEITIPVIPGDGLDIRSIVYLGARMNLSEQRLSNALRQFGSYFVLKPESIDTLDRYGFTDAERTILVELQAGTSLYELEAAHRDIDPRMVQAVLYALFACQACEISEAPAVPRAPTVKVAPAATKPARAPSPPSPAALPPRPEPAPYGPFVGKSVDTPSVRPPTNPPVDRQPAARAPQPSTPPDTRPSGRPPEAIFGRTVSEEFRQADPLGDVEPPPPPVTPAPPPDRFARPSQMLMAKSSSEPEYPVRTPTPPVTGLSPGGVAAVHRASSDSMYPITGRISDPEFPDRTPTNAGRSPQSRAMSENEFLQRVPTGTGPRPSGAPRAGTENPFPMRTPTPPVTGLTPDNEFPSRMPTPPVGGRLGSEFPMRTPTPVTGRPPSDEFPMRTPTPPVTGRVSTENPFPSRMPTPPVSGRTPSENDYPQRTPTPPHQSRTSTENPFPQRSPTPPVESRTASNRTGRPVNGPDEPGIPRGRAGTNSPRTMTPAAIDPLNPPTTRGTGIDPLNPATARTTTPRPGGAPAAPRAPTSNPVVARTATGNPPTGGPVVARTTTARKTAALIAARVILLDQGADHFALLGVPFDAPVEQVRTTYLNLVRQLHPDKLNELDLDDPNGNAHRLFAAMGAAFSVLTDPVRRQAYVASIVGAGAGTPRTKTGDDITTPAMEAFRRGEAALRRDEPHEAVEHFRKAVELAPQDVDFTAMLGWATFCASREKDKIFAETKKALERAIQRSQKPMNARFLLGRVERMLGRDREALRHFQIVLDELPNHTEARSEVRAIETRLANNVGKKR